jgi:hypothetical protein
MTQGATQIPASVRVWKKADFIERARATRLMESALS